MSLYERLWRATAPREMRKELQDFASWQQRILALSEDHWRRGDDVGPPVVDVYVTDFHDIRLVWRKEDK